MRSMVEGFFQTSKSPSTALRAVPLPCRCRGGFEQSTPAKIGACENRCLAPIISLAKIGAWHQLSIYNRKRRRELVLNG